MDDFWKTLLWQQFGAAIDMLEDATRACPDDLWSNVRKSRYGSRRALSGFGMSYTTRSSGWILFIGIGTGIRTAVRNFFSTGCVTFSIM